ncbi:MAG: alpha/beta fold hydrolase [Bryobacteraceae bacterium]|jgi:acetyl esterase/lipase
MSGILDIPAPAAGRRIPYGPEALHFGDLRLPAGAGPHPLLIFIHGGFWRARRNLEYAGHLCATLAERGVASWNIEYRRVGDSGGGFPGTLDDVLMAGRFVEELAQSHPFDLTRVTVAGHSAGGQLALWLAAQECLPLRRAISLAGVTDLRRGSELHLGDGAIDDFMGGSPAQVGAAYRAASPIDLLPIRTPQLMIHGTLDDVVPVELSDRFAAASQNCEFLRLEGADHFDIVDPRSRFWPAVIEELAR